MVAGHLREKRGIYYMILSYTNENGERVTPTKSTGLPVKGNKKRAEAMLNEWRKSEDLLLKKRKANGSLNKLDPGQEILFTKFMLDWLESIGGVEGFSGALEVRCRRGLFADAETSRR